MTEAADDQIGRVILGRYRIVHMLAQGGMGLIYLARSEGAAGFVKPVVVKRILADFVRDEAMIKMFKREAHIMSNLRHPNIVSVIDFGQERNAYFMVLDYVHGFHLGRWYRFLRAVRGLFPVEIGIHIVIEMLDALHYAHTLTNPEGRKLGIVHRDVTPSNVLIDVHGHVKLADFGIAQMRAETTEFKTSETTIKGKFPYIAPEVFRGGEPSAISDVYSAGVVLHELLTGKNEFRTRDVSSTIVKVLQHTPSALRAIRNDVPEPLEVVIARALAKDPNERYQSAGEFASALRQVRQRNADEISAELQQAARTDFFDPRMSQMAAMPSLEELEQKWRNPPKFSRPPEHDEPGVEMVEKLSLEPADILSQLGSKPSKSQPGAPSASPPRTWIWIAISAIVVVLLGLVGWQFVPRVKPPSQAPVILYSGKVSNEDMPPEESADDVPADAPKDDSAKAASDNEGAKSTDGKPDGRSASRAKQEARMAATPKAQDPYSRALSKKSAQIQSCFEANADAIANVTKVVIRFEVDAQGKVSDASITPAELDNSPLGRCVVGVAKTTEFPAEGSPLTLRIPISTRVSRR